MHYSCISIIPSNFNFYCFFQNYILNIWCVIYDVYIHWKCYLWCIWSWNKFRFYCFCVICEFPILNEFLIFGIACSFHKYIIVFVQVTFHRSLTNQNNQAFSSKQRGLVVISSHASVTLSFFSNVHYFFILLFIFHLFFLYFSKIVCNNKRIRESCVRFFTKQKLSLNMN